MKIGENTDMAEERVRFQGRVIASVSHELKNALATVSESAGLLSDLVTESGLEAGVREEILSCAEAIVEDLRRSFGIVRTLNVFAHTADESVSVVDVVELVDLVVTIAGYKSRARTVVVEGPSDGSVRVKTCPLLLEDFLHQVLDAASRVLPRGPIVRIRVSGRGGAEITFHGLECGGLGDVISDESRGVLDALNGGLRLDLTGDELVIRLPPSIEDGSRI